MCAVSFDQEARNCVRLPTIVWFHSQMLLQTDCTVACSSCIIMRRVSCTGTDTAASARRGHRRLTTLLVFSASKPIYHVYPALAQTAPPCGIPHLYMFQAPMYSFVVRLTRPRISPMAIIEANLSSSSTSCTFVYIY